MMLSKGGNTPNLKASLIKLIGRGDICRGERLAGGLSAGVGGRGVCWLSLGLEQTPSGPIRRNSARNTLPQGSGPTHLRGS